MDIYLKFNNGNVVELCGRKNPLDFLKEELSKYAYHNDKMFIILLTLGGCLIPAPQKYSYFAWITESDSFISIRYSGIKDEHSREQQHEGIYITGFNSQKIKPEEVGSFLQEHVPVALLKASKEMLDALEVLM